MDNRPTLIVESNIPFIAGRLERWAQVRYLPPEEFVAENIADADALIVRTRTRCDQMLLEHSRVQFIASATIGTDHIDMRWCKGHGITVCNAPGCNAPAVAQYVWSAILHSHINPSDITIGVVGVGNVGSIVAEWGRLLGANVLLCDPPKARHLKPDMRSRYIPLDQMLPLCDIVTLHTPLTYEGEYPTYHMISTRELQLMRKDSTLINAARGAVIDTQALLNRLKTQPLNTIIDCWEGEPTIDTTLLKHSAIATPHIAGYSHEGKQRATRMAIEAVMRHFGATEADIAHATAGLSPDYSPSSSIDAQIISRSYNPIADTDALKSDPNLFESLRASYHYRHEP